MKKKLLTLFTLALLGMGSVWAASPTDPSASDFTAVKTFTETELIFTNAQYSADPANWATGWVVCGKSSDRTTFSIASSKKYYLNPTTDVYSSESLGTLNGVNLKSGNDQKTLYFYVTNVTKVEAYVTANGGTTGGLKISYVGSSTSNTASLGEGTLSAKATLDGLDAATKYIIKIEGTTSTDSPIYAIRFTAAITTDPVISASNASITATESGVAVEKGISVTGSNLTGSTLTAELNPAVEGLSVELGSGTITDGSISTTATLSYTATANASGTTMLTLSDGTTTKDVTITYKASVVAWELQSVSEAITWNWEQSPLNSKTVEFGKDDYADYTTSDWYVMANISGITYPDDFDATKISFKGQYPTRNGLAQACTFKIHTTVPGSFNITFSGTGSTASERWVKVTDGNGDHQGSTEVSGTTHLSETFKVVAGDVEITGTGALRFYKIVFTPVTQVSGNFTESGYNTYSTNYPVDLSTITGGTAYVATSVTNGKVVLTKCSDKVAVGTGLFIAKTGNSSSFTIQTYAGDATFSGTNLLVGMPNGGTVSAAVEGYNYVFGWTEVTNPGFYLINGTAATLENFKAYLHTSDALSTSASRLSLMFGDEASGISATQMNSERMNGEMFDLQGRRVAQPQKGLYIVNGKKVIIK